MNVYVCKKHGIRGSENKEVMWVVGNGYYCRKCMEQNNKSVKMQKEYPMKGMRRVSVYKDTATYYARMIKRMPRKCFESLKPKCGVCSDTDKCEYLHFMVYNDVEGKV